MVGGEGGPSAPLGACRASPPEDIFPQMMGRGGVPEDLAARLWAGQVADRAAPGRALCDAVGAGARHGAVLAGLRTLWRAGLDGWAAAQAACRRWPGSVAMAAVAFDLAPEAARAAALEDLAARCEGRAAVLARAHLRAAGFGAARAVLAGAEEAEAVRLRAVLALEAGDFEAAAEDIARLGAAGEALGARLVWLRDGAAALAGCAAPETAGGWAELCAIALQERDAAGAEAALRAWVCAGGSGTACARARARLALLRREPAAARDLLAARLDGGAPCDWAAADHVLWLRAGLDLGDDPQALRAHAAAACRVDARHDGLRHLWLLCREAACDWGEMASVPRGSGGGRAQAAHFLRLGLPGRAAGVIAAALRCGGRPGARAALWALRAEALLQGGRPGAAAVALARGRAVAWVAPRRADLALVAGDLALWRCDPAAGLAALAPVARDFPARPALWPLLVRLHFTAGDLKAAQAALERHADLQAARGGAAPDLRDLMVADALQGADGPGAAAMALAAAQVRFVPAVPGADIPRRVAHYWEGAQSPAQARARARWVALHPGFTQRVFDAESAHAWIAAQEGAKLAERFAALPRPALRADLFRLCLMRREGGIFADLDEFPRLPVTPWLEGARVVLCRERGFGTVANNFLAAAPGQVLFDRALALVLAALDGTETPYAWWHSGPAQLTRALAEEIDTPEPGLRLLAQADYCRRVSTNLPWPHKRGPEHWRNAGAVDSDAGFT